MNLKKILTLALFLFVLALGNTFGEKIRYRFFECSDYFKKIKEAFRERLYDACLEKDFFIMRKIHPELVDTL